MGRYLFKMSYFFEFIGQRDRAVENYRHAFDALKNAADVVEDSPRCLAEPRKSMRNLDHVVVRDALGQHEVVLEGNRQGAKPLLRAQPLKRVGRAGRYDVLRLRHGGRQPKQPVGQRLPAVAFGAALMVGGLDQGHGPRQGLHDRIGSM